MLLCALVLCAAAPRATVFGIDANTSLVSISLKSGKMTELSAEHHEELDAQEVRHRFPKHHATRCVLPGL